MEAWEMVVAALAVATGAWVQGGAGIGAALLAAPVLVLVEPDLVPGSLIVAFGTLTALMVVRERHHLDLGGLGWALAGRVPGTVLGALALAVIPSSGIDIAFGLLIAGFVLASVSGIHVAVNPRSLFVAGGVSGLSGTATSVGGPPMALVLQHETGGRLRANLAAFFTVGIGISVAGLVAVGEFGWWDLRAGLLLSVPSAVGFALSGPTTRFLDDGRTRAAVLAISGSSSVIVLARGLSSLI